MKVKLKRGDTRSIYVTFPADIAPSGSVVYFMAKPAPDDDINDESAAINKYTTDFESVDNGKKVRYHLRITPADTAMVKTSGAGSVKLRGEFEIRTPGGEVYSIPDNDKYIDVIVYADIRRAGNGWY